MKKTKFLVFAFISMAIVFSNCKKKTDDTTTTTNPPVPVNYLCDGNNTTSFYPLVLNNLWNYSFTISGQAQSDKDKKVTGTEVKNGITYFVVTESGYFETYRREDPTSHNIYFYGSDNADHLLVPNSPTLNQTWSSGTNSSRKVTNVSASITTANCSYTGLVEITVTSNSIISKEYYKRGLGMVYWCSGDASTVYALNSVTLK